MPYSPYLLLKYQCHINVEVCLSVRGVKYLYKYVHKGPDRAMVALHTNQGALDEIKLYQDVRSLGSSEGCWRTFNFAMYSRNPPVHALCLHLENGQRTYFQEGAERAAVDAGPPTTCLTAWFRCVRDLAAHERQAARDGHGQIVWCASAIHLRILPSKLSLTLSLLCVWARPATYASWPERYKYDSRRRCWTQRIAQLEVMSDVKHIGRVHNAHPSSGEVFYLRILLHHVTASDLELTAGNVDAFTFEVRMKATLPSLLLRLPPLLRSFHYFIHVRTCCAGAQIFPG